MPDKIGGAHMATIIVLFELRKLLLMISTKIKHSLG